jgi:hypothetical protein
MAAPTKDTPVTISEETLAPSAGGGGADTRSSTAPAQYNARSWRSYPRRKLASGVVKTTPHQIYEVPNGASVVVECFFLTSITSNNTDFRLYHTRAGEAPTTSNALFYDTTASGKTTLRYDGPIYLVSGDRIWTSAANSDRIAITLYGVEA